MKWSVEAAIVAAGVLIAAAIMLTNRWQISAIGYSAGGARGGYASESVYRMDRWSGSIEHCVLVADPSLAKTADLNPVGTHVQCPAPEEVPANATLNKD